MSRARQGWTQAERQTKELRVVEVVQRSDQDAFWVPYFGGFPGRSTWEETLGSSQNSLDGLYISSGLRTPTRSRGRGEGGLEYPA